MFLRSIQILTVSILFSTVTIFSQKVDEFKDFTRLTSRGDIPDDILLRASAKLAQDITVEVKDEDNKHVQKTKEQFLLKSNYMLDELLTSGRVLFGDEVSSYVQKVSRKLLENEPELMSELRFYTLKSNITNAFTTNQGMVFVTTGLLSQLTNEAQLAFVLAHEITHYTKKHVINTYLEADRMYSERGRYKYNNYDNDIIKLSNYSKSLEFESDSAGFYYIEKAGYDIDEAYSIFDVLQFSYLPYDEIDFNEAMFETEYMKFPEEFILDTIVEINFDVEEDDSRSTHPNINKRRDKIRGFKKNSSSKSKSKYLVSKDEFLRVRELCRFEAIRLNLKNREYVKAIYNSQVLLRQHPENKFLEKSILKALYGIYVYKSYNKYHKIVDSDDEEGNISAACYFFDQMDDKLAGSIFLNKAWSFYSDTKDEFFKRLIDDVVYKMQDKTEIEFKDFQTIEAILAVKEKIRQDSIAAIELEIAKAEMAKNDSINGHDIVEEVEEDQPISKYEKIRILQKAKEDTEVEEAVESKSEENLYTLAIAHLSNLNKLENIFELQRIKLDSVVAAEKAADEYWNSLSYKQRRKINNVDYKGLKNDSTEIRNVLFVDPEYFEVDERKGVKLMNSEEKKFEYIEQLSEVSEISNLRSGFLSGKLMEKQNVDLYNQLAIYNDWFGEILSHQETKKDIDIIPSEADLVIKISTESDTDYLIYNGVITYKNKKDNIATTLLVTTVIYPLLPFGILYAVTPDFETYFYTIVLDPKSSKVIDSEVLFSDGKMNKGEVKSHIYELMYYIQY